MTILLILIACLVTYVMTDYYYHSKIENLHANHSEALFEIDEKAYAIGYFQGTRDAMRSQKSTNL